MTREEAIRLIKWLKCTTNREDDLEAIDMAIEAIRHDVIFEQIKWERDVALQTLEEHGIGLGQKAQNVYNLYSGDLISREDAIDAICKTWCYTTYPMCPHVDDGHCKGYDEIEAISALQSANTIRDDTQTEERARFVAKETELAHIEAKLENTEKRLQSVCTANFVAEQLDRLRNMTDEEKWEFFKRFFEMKGGAK